jgi:hypothetical protein
MAKVQKPAPATRSKVPPSRMPQRSEGLAGNEDIEGMQPIPAAKGKKMPLPAAKPSRKTAHR